MSEERRSTVTQFNWEKFHIDNVKIERKNNSSCQDNCVVKQEREFVTLAYDLGNAFTAADIELFK